MMLAPLGAWAQDNIEYYGITVGGVEVTSANAMSVEGENISNGMVLYSAQDNTLTLNGATIMNGTGITCQGDLNLSIIGSVVVNGSITSSKQNGATLTLKHGDDLAANLTYIPSSGGAASGFTSIVYNGMYLSPENGRNLKYVPSKQRYEDCYGNYSSTVKFTSVKSYELWLGETMVTDANINDILDSKTTPATATFNPTNNTLTLNGMVLNRTSINNSGIISRLDALKISLNGDNSITCSGSADSCTAIRADKEGAQTLTIEYGGNDGSLTFTAGHAIRDFNSLTLTGLYWGNGNNYVYENATTSSNNGVHTGTQLVDKSGNSPVEVGNATLSLLTYNLRVGGEDVTYANASNITGDQIEGTVSYNANSNTLTLDGATINGDIGYWESDELTIVVNGVNTAGQLSSTSNIKPNLKFKKDENATGVCKLTLSDPDYTCINEFGMVDFGDMYLQTSEPAYYYGLSLRPRGGYDQHTATITSEPYYPLWIGNTQVTEDNKDHILGSNNTTVRFTPATANSNNTLILDNANLTDFIFYPENSNLTIALKGTNTSTSFIENPLDNNNSVLYFKKAEGATDCSLTIDVSNSGNNCNNNSCAITGFYNLDLNGGSAVVTGTSTQCFYSNGYGIMADGLGAAPDEVSNVTIQPYTTYQLWVDGKQVNDINASNITGDGKVSFTVSGGADTGETYTLTLKGTTLTKPLIVGLPNLTIDVQGTNNITTSTTCLQKMENTNPSLTIKSTSDVVGSLILTNTDGESLAGVSGIGDVTISKELAPILRNYGNYTSYMYEFTNGGCDKAMFVPSYGVKIGNLYVYEGNATDVLGDGKISFDKTNHKLTLTDAVVGGSNEGSISTWLPALTIEVVGNNKLTSGSQSTLQSLYGENVAMTVQSTGETKGCLVLNMGSSQGGGFTGEHVTLNITKPLEVVSGDLTVNDGNLNVVTIGEPVNYELLVEDIRVVAANASNITHDTNRSDRPYASYDAATNTLTLDNCDYNYYYWLGDKVPIQSNIQNLKVKLVGDNEVTLGTKVFKYTGSAAETAPTLTFVSDYVDWAFGSLIINGATSTADIASGYEVASPLLPAETNQGSTGWLYSLGSTNAYVKLWYQEAYGITVTKDDVTVSVTNANRTNVLNDANASVQFDGRRRLVLNGAELTSIVVSATNNLPETGLDIYLKGNNTITNDLGYAIKSEGVAAMVELAFHTGADDPGTLEYTNTGSASENVFPGFNVSYFNKLAEIVDDTKTRVMIPLNLITDDVIDPAIIDYGNDPEYSSSTTLNNVTIEDVLYTLNDNGTPDAPDGFVSGVGGKLSLVINSTMTDLEVEASDALVPGTSAYYGAYQGLTFIVPAGTGVITLYNIVTQPGYAFHVRVGNQPPVEITSADVVDVPYACSDVSYVKLYLVNLAIDPYGAPAMKVDHRIGPKSSVAGALGGVKVSNSSVQSSAADPAAPYKAMEKGTMATDLTKLVDPYNGYTCNDLDITDLPDNLCVDNTPAPAINPAPRRGGDTSTILPEGLTYLDFSGTKITGMEVSRTSGPFNGVPENVFIYMPAGNTTKDKNVVIGDICDNVELDGSTSAKPFKALKNFTAGQATLKRTFEELNGNNRATIYLPYNIAQGDANNLGTFYEYAGNDGTTVSMSKVTTGGLKANMPYIFEAKEGGVIDPMVHGVDIVADPAETQGFKGVYKRKDYEAGMYCYAGEDKGGKYTVGQFVEMGPGSYVPPFRAYMIGSGVPSYAIAWDGVINNIDDENTTAVETVKTATNVKTQDGWWTINGMRLNAQPKKAGLYILNGRMVVVK